jgi:hypothetical protein
VTKTENFRYINKDNFKWQLNRMSAVTLAILAEPEEEWAEVVAVVRDEGIRSNYPGIFLTG